ncbi:MAG: reductase [Pseudomonadota bacterium]
MAKTVAIIGAGQIGYAAADAFRDRGWDVTVYARTKPNWFDGTLHKFQPYEVGEAAAPSADIVFDSIAFDRGDVARYCPDRVGRLIAISSASVYCDDQGRTFDEAVQNGFPEFDGAIDEDQSTVAPGPETYSTRKVRMENKALEMFGDRATIFRPCAIYGKHSRHPREWWFVKRLIDGRTRIPLIEGGTSRFQPTDVEDISCFAVDAAEQELSGAYNIATEDCPTVLQIGQILADFLDYDPEFVPSDQTGLVGRTPWSVPKPFVVSGRKMIETGYDPPSSYWSGMFVFLPWLRDLNPTDWRKTFPQLAAYPWDLFDYEAEDRLFDERH